MIAAEIMSFKALFPVGGTTHKVSVVLEWVFRFFPGFCMGDGPPRPEPCCVPLCAARTLNRQRR